MILRKITLYAFDPNEECTLGDMIQLLENQKYFSAHVSEVHEVDVGEWSDDHMLNQTKTTSMQIEEKYFKKKENKS